MKTKSIIYIALAVIFNDFIGAVFCSIGILIIKLGNLVTSLPTFF